MTEQPNARPDAITLEALENERGDVGQRLRSLMETSFELSQQEKALKALKEANKHQIDAILFSDLNKEFTSITDGVFGSLSIIPAGKAQVVRECLEENMIMAGIPAATVTKVIEDSRSSVKEYTKYNPPRDKKE